MNKPCQIIALSRIRQACQIQTTFMSSTWLYFLKKWLHTLNETSGAACCQNNKLHCWKCFHHFASAGPELKNYFIKTTLCQLSTIWIGFTGIWRGGGVGKREALLTTFALSYTPFPHRITGATVIFHAQVRKRNRMWELANNNNGNDGGGF